jgi:hypothetical protein
VARGRQVEDDNFWRSGTNEADGTQQTERLPRFWERERRE